ncbi:MAG TPA: hypothetical protein PLI95_02215 [Polyangiaceae bacterium]|nr:hypothetical protein [Polyangiaceae bacterium]
MATESVPLPAATGTLDKTPLVHLIVYILRRKLDGTLVLQGDVEDEHAIYFKAGMPALVRTLFDTPHPGEVAVRLGFIDRSQHEQSLVTAGATGFQHLELLKTAEMLTLPQYEATLRELVHDGMLALCRQLPASASYAFHPGVNLAKTQESDPVAPSDPYPILWRAVSDGSCDASVGDALARLGMTPVGLPDDAVLDDFGFRREEALAIEALRGTPMTVERLISMGFLSESAWRRLVYVLLITRNLEVEGSGRSSLVPPPSLDPSPPRSNATPETPAPSAPLVRVTNTRPERPSAEPELVLALPRKTPRASVSIASAAPATPEPPPTPVAPPAPRAAPYLFSLALLPLLAAVFTSQRLDDRIARAAQRFPPLLDAVQRSGPVSAAVASLPEARLEGSHVAAASFVHWAYALGSVVLVLGAARTLFARDARVARQSAWAALVAWVAGFVLLQGMQLASAAAAVPSSADAGAPHRALATLSFCYRAPLDPDTSFLLAAAAYSLFAISLELLKLLPVARLVLRSPATGAPAALAVGLGSGIGLGIAQSLVYAPSHLHGLLGFDAYAVRFVTSTALHGVWAGIAALAVAGEGGPLSAAEGGLARFGAPLRVVLGVVALHALYDTMERRGMVAGSLLIAVVSFGWFAWKADSSRLRSSTRPVRSPAAS